MTKRHPKNIAGPNVDMATYKLEDCLATHSAPYPRCTDKWVASQALTNLRDLKAGLYFRVYYQPLFKVPFVVSTVRLFNKPFRHTSSTGRHWKMPLVKSTSFVDKTKILWYLDSQTYVESLGVRPLPLRDKSTSNPHMIVRLFRFSNRLQIFLKNLQEGDIFLSYCWLHNATPTPDVFKAFKDYVDGVLWEEEMFERYFKT